MSLREIATTTAASVEDAARKRKKADGEKELEARIEYAIATLAPLVTAEQVTVTSRTKRIPLLRHEYGGGHFGPSHDVWKMSAINGTSCGPTTSTSSSSGTRRVPARAS